MPTWDRHCERHFKNYDVEMKGTDFNVGLGHFLWESDI